MLIKLDQIIPDPDQPRKTFKEETLQELKSSYDKLGLIQPVTVRLCDSKYQIVIGERRYRAALLNRQEEIECIVREDVDDRKAREMQFAENSQQEDIPPLELGRAFVEHRKKYKITQEELAKVVGLSFGYISDLESLIRAAPILQDYIQSGDLDTSTAHEISTIKDEKRQEELANFVVSEGLARSAVRKLKPLIEAQKFRPVANIYASQVAEKKIPEPVEVPGAKQLLEESEIPVNILELKLGWEETTLRAKTFDLTNLDLLTPDQKANLIIVGENCIEAIQDIVDYMKGIRLLEE